MRKQRKINISQAHSLYEAARQGLMMMKQTKKMKTRKALLYVMRLRKKKRTKKI